MSRFAIDIVTHCVSWALSLLDRESSARGRPDGQRSKSFRALALASVLALVGSAPAIAGIYCPSDAGTWDVYTNGKWTSSYTVSCERTIDTRGGWGSGGGRNNEGGGGRPGETIGNGGGPNDDGLQAAAPTCQQGDPSSVTDGNPVVLATGNKIERESDFSSGGPMPLHLNRTWNQHWDGNGLFGWKWVSNFDYRLSFGTRSSFAPSGTCYARPGIPECSDTTSHTEIWAHRPDGRMIRFLKNANDGIYYENKTNPVSKIVRLADGQLLLTFEDNLIERYSNGGYPLWIEDEYGIRWTFTYGGLNSTQVQRVTHTNGRYVQFIWDYDELREVRDTAGTAYKFTYTAQKYDSNLNKLIGLHIIRTTSRPALPATTITYHLAGESGEPASPGYYALSGKSFNGIRYSRFAYSGKYAISTEHAGAVDRHTFSYTTGTNGALIVQTTNPLGKQATYDFVNGKLLAVTGHPSANCGLTGSDYTYDANGYVDKFTDNNGNITDYDYDGAGRLVKRVDAYGSPVARTTTYAWDSPASRIKEETVVGHSKATYNYASDGRIASVTLTNLSQHGVANQARTTTYSYAKHPNGLLASMVVDGPLAGNGDAVTSAYDSLGNLTEVRNSLGHATTYSNYNALGFPGRITSPNGAITDYVYDARGRPTTVERWINGAWQTTAYAYDGAGRLASVQRPDGQTRRYEYDAAWRLIREYETEAPGVAAQKRYTYNVASLVTRVDTERVYAPTGVPSLTTPASSSTGSYSISWTSVSDTTAYQLEESLNGGAWALIHNASGTSKAISGKTNGTYSYRVRACNAWGCGPYSTSDTVVVSLSGPPTAPTLTSPPSYNYGGAYNVAWGSVSGASSYRLEESRNSGAWSEIYVGTGTSVSLSKGMSATFSYRARACNSYGCSVYSAVRTVVVEVESCPTCRIQSDPLVEPATATEGEGA